MSNDSSISDALAGLSDDERKQWQDAFGSIPALQQSAPTQQAPIVQAPPDNPPPPIDVDQAAQAQHAWNSERNFGDTSPSAQLSDSLAQMDPKTRGAWLAQFGGGPVQQNAEPGLGTYRGREYDTTAAAEGGGVKNARDLDPALQGPNYPPPARTKAEAHDLENAKRIQAGQLTIEEEYKRSLKKKHPGWNENILNAEAMRYADQLRGVTSPETAPRQMEDTLRARQGRPSVDEENRLRVREGRPPIAHAIFGLGATDQDLEARGIGQDAQRETGAADGKQLAQAAAQTGQAMGGNQAPLQQPLPQRFTLPETVITAPRQGTTSVLHSDTPEGQADIARTRQELGLDRPAPAFTAPTVIPGQRRPAMWNVQEGQQVPDEDRGRLDEATMAQQGAIEAGRLAGIEGAEARAKDLATQQQALADIDKMNRDRALGRQKATADEVDKLRNLQAKIRSQELGDDHMFLFPGAAGKFFAAIGQAIAAGGAARTHTPNAAAELVKNHIDEMLAEQKVRNERNVQQLGAQKDLLGAMREQFGDEVLGDQAAKIAYLQRAKMHSDEIAQSSAIPRINANASVLSADLDKQLAKEHTAFDMAAQDKVTRRDIMTKDQVIGGGPAGDVGGEEADPKLVVRMGGYSLAGIPENTDFAVRSPQARERVESVVSAHASIMQALDHLEDIANENPAALYMGGIKGVGESKTHRDWQKTVETITRLQGELQGQKRMPNESELQRMYDNWKLNPVSGVTAQSLIDNARREANRIAANEVWSQASENTRRALGRNEKGEVRPMQTYTGETQFRKPPPPGFHPVPHTQTMARDRGPQPLDMSHPARRQITTHVSKAGKRTETSEPVRDEEDEEP